MAVKDTTKETIARELALLLKRVRKTADIDDEYRVVIQLKLADALDTLDWEKLGIPFEVFKSTK